MSSRQDLLQPLRSGERQHDRRAFVEAGIVPVGQEFQHFVALLHHSAAAVDGSDRLALVPQHAAAHAAVLRSGDRAVGDEQRHVSLHAQGPRVQQHAAQFDEGVRRVGFHDAREPGGFFVGRETVEGVGNGVRARRGDVVRPRSIEDRQIVLRRRLPRGRIGHVFGDVFVRADDFPALRVFEDRRAATLRGDDDRSLFRKRGIRAVVADDEVLVRFQFVTEIERAQLQEV